MRIMLSAFAISILCTPLHAQAPEEAPFWRPVVMGTFGMVAAEHPLESMAGWQVLEAGGNAFDAQREDHNECFSELHQVQARRLGR